MILLTYVLFTNPYVSNIYLGWFPYVYIWGVYTERYLKNIMDNKFFNLTIALLSFGLMIVTNTELEQLSILNLVCAVFTLLYFNTLEIKYNKTINELAKYTLGIYAIHDNMYIRKYVIKKALYIKEMYYTNYFVIYTVILAILIYAVSLAIDVIREKVFSKVMFKNKKMDKMYNKVNGSVEKVCKVQY